MDLSENRVYPNLWPFIGYENWGSVGTIFSNTPRSTLWKLFACLCQGIHKYFLHSFLYLSHRRHRIEELLSALMTSTCLGMESSDLRVIQWSDAGIPEKETWGPPVFDPSLAGTLFHGFLRAVSNLHGTWMCIPGWKVSNNHIWPTSTTSMMMDITYHDTPQVKWVMNHL